MFALLVISILGNIVLGVLFYRIAQQRLALAAVRQPVPREERLAPVDERKPRPLHPFVLDMRDGVRVSYWAASDDDEPIMAIYFERAGEQVLGSATVSVPSDHFLVLDDSFPPKVVPGTLFRSTYRPARVAFTAGEPKFKNPAIVSTTLGSGKIEMPQEEIDKIVAEHEFLASLWKQKDAEEATESDAKP